MSTHTDILRNNADDFVTFQMEMYGGGGGGGDDGNVEGGELENGETQPIHHSEKFHPEIHEHNWAIATVTLNGLHYNHLPEHELIVYGNGGYLAYRNGNLYGKLKQVTPPSTVMGTTITTATTSSTMASHGENGGNTGNNGNGNGNSSGFLNSLGNHSCSSSSGHESGASSFSKESIFYLDDFDAAYHQQPLELSSLGTSATTGAAAATVSGVSSGNGSLISTGSNSGHPPHLSHHHLYHHSQHHHPPTIGHLPPQLLPHTTAKWHVWPELYQRALFHLVATLREAFFGGDTAAVHELSNGTNKEGDHSVHSMFCPPLLTVTSNGSSEDLTATTTTSTVNIPGSASEQLLEQIHWIKDPLAGAASFEDGIYIQMVIEAIKQSNEEHRWIRIFENTESLWKNQV